MISTTNFLGISDNIARTLLDLKTAFITNPTLNAPTSATIANGQNAASNSLEARIAALGSIIQEAALANPGIAAATGIIGYMDVTPANFYAIYASLMLALDNLVVGVNNFLTLNSLQVHPEFANAFNYAASNAVSLGLALSPLTTISPTNIFVPASQTLASIAVTGVTTGSLTAGTPINTSLYAPEQLYITNILGSSSTGTATNFTITYTNAAGTTAIVSQALSGSLPAGANIAVTGAIGSAVSAISITSGAAGDQFGIIVLPLRTVTY
jgi:hypothetical protein